MNIALHTTIFIHKKILTWVALFNAFLFIPFEKIKHLINIVNLRDSKGNPYNIQI